jgi:hypothetical protein
MQYAMLAPFAFHLSAVTQAILPIICSQVKRHPGEWNISEFLGLLMCLYFTSTSRTVIPFQNGKLAVGLAFISGTL